MTDQQYLYLAKLIAKDFNCEINTPSFKTFEIVSYSRNARGEKLAIRNTEKELFEFLLAWVS